MKPSAISRVGRPLLNLDMFGEDIKLRINGEQSMKSLTGLFLSIVIFLLIAPYSFKKYKVMLDYDDVDVQSRTEKNALTSDYKTQFEIMDLGFFVSRSYGGD